MRLTRFAGCILLGLLVLLKEHFCQLLSDPAVLLLDEPTVPHYHSTNYQPVISKI